MITAQCCRGERPWRRLARRRAWTTASIFSGAVLVLLPKCPLCLAAWLTFGTGVAVSAAAVERMRGMVVIFWIAAVGLAAVQIIRRRVN